MSTAKAEPERCEFCGRPRPWWKYPCRIDGTRRYVGACDRAACKQQLDDLARREGLKRLDAP